MAQFSQVQAQKSSQIQKQTQRISRVQIQSLNMLNSGVNEIRDEIYNEVETNPALEIVQDVREWDIWGDNPKGKRSAESDDFQKTLESTENHGETLQEHLLHQINLINLSPEEQEISQKLIYNLDKNGFYGTMLAPESFLNKSNPLHTKALLEKCIKRIQELEPVGTCCKTPEESLYVQAKLNPHAPAIALFLLNGHLDFLNPPKAQRVYNNLKNFQEKWKKMKFAKPTLLDKVPFTVEDVQTAIDFILRLNPHPAQNYLKDTNSEFINPDIVLRVKKIKGPVSESSYEEGLVAIDKNWHFQIQYASGLLPQLKIVTDFGVDKESVARAKELIDSLEFRESSIVIQGCAIVEEQMDFFLKGPEYLKSLTRRTIAQKLNIHESTVTRMASKKSSKYIQTEWGLYPASYFFSSGVGSSIENTISSTVIKQKIGEIVNNHRDERLSDLKLTELLNEEGIKIARRTVTKYRLQSGMENSYKR